MGGTGTLTGIAVGTEILPGPGTVIGAAAGGLYDIFSGPDAKQQAANVGGRTIDARQIWEQISPGSSNSLHEGASAASTLQQVHDQRSQQIDAINQAMDAAWQGDASVQVQAGAHPLGIWLRDSASNLNKSGTYLTNQAGAFDSAQSKVQEIAATPPHAGFVDHINPWSDKDDEINKYNQQGQTNVEAFNAYYNASAQNAAGMPQYQAWQGNNFSDGKDHNGTDNNDENHKGTGTDPGGHNGSYPPGGTVNPPGGTPRGYGTGDMPNGLHTGYNPNGVGNGLGDGSGSGYNPGSYKSPNWDGTTAAGYTPPSTSGTDFGTGGFGPGGSSFGTGGGSGSGAGGIGGGAGGIGAGGFGPGGSGSLGGGASTGSGAAGAGAGAGRGGGIGGGAGAAGAAGRSGMGGMGGGGRGGKGEDDEEHETKYLVGEDPNEIFGTDELTAPPVIGE